MADMAGRLRMVERKLSWLMDSMRMKVAISSGIMGPDGKPVASRVMEGSLNEIYALTREIAQVNESDGVPPPPLEQEQE